MKKIKGAYALVVSSPRKTDRSERSVRIKALVYRKKRQYIFSGIRKLVQLHAVDAEFVRDVHPGEIVTITKGRYHIGYESWRCPEKAGKMYF